MIDLHTHVLPNVDDGARSLAESVAMCRLAAAQGCEVIVATPHQRHPHWWNDDRRYLAELRSRLQEELGESPRVLEGGEIRIGSRWDLLDELAKAEEAGVAPLAGSRYLLVELARDGVGPEPEEVVHELAIHGWRPILAHPEVFPWLAGDLGRLGELVDLGATLQITAMSVTGEFGRRPHAAALAMLDAGLVHFVASDCHGLERRPPGLRAAYEKVAARQGADTARRLFRDNGRAVIENRPLPPRESP